MAKFFCGYCCRLNTVTDLTCADNGVLYCHFQCWQAARQFERNFSDQSIQGREVKTDLIIWLRKKNR